MKKLLLSIGVVLTSIALNAQTTITNHFEGAVAAPSPANWNIGSYTWSGGNGYVSGTNSYNDNAVLQKFDASYGITSSGVINSVKVCAASKKGSTSQITVGIWENNAGVPGALLGSVLYTLADIDTAVASIQFITDGVSAKGIYNIDAVFTTPIAIPANMSFYAGITIPNGDNGDTLAIMTTTMPGYVFADATTHAGVLTSTNTFDGFGNYDVDVANAIFPNVTLVASLNENAVSAKVYPNPASDDLTIELNTNATSVSIIGMDGKVISTESVNANSVTVNVSALVAGVYVYEIVADNGEVVRNTFVKK